MGGKRGYEGKSRHSRLAARLGGRLLLTGPPTASNCSVASFSVSRHLHSFEKARPRAWSWRWAMDETLAVWMSRGVEHVLPIDWFKHCKSKALMNCWGSYDLCLYPRALRSKLVLELFGLISKGDWVADKRRRCRYSGENSRVVGGFCSSIGKLLYRWTYVGK